MPAHKRGKQAREARRSQCLIPLAGRAADALDRSHRIVADAIDRKEDPIGAADEAGEKSLAMFDAAVMMQEARPGPFDEPFELRVLMRATADVKQRAPRDVRG